MPNARSAVNYTAIDDDVVAILCQILLELFREFQREGTIFLHFFEMFQKLPPNPETHRVRGETSLLPS